MFRSDRKRKPKGSESRVSAQETPGAGICGSCTYRSAFGAKILGIFYRKRKYSTGPIEGTGADFDSSICDANRNLLFYDAGGFLCI